MPIENPNFLSNYIFDNVLGDSWDFFVNRNEINAYWDGELHKLGNLYLQAINTDAGKGLFTCPVEPKSERHLFLFNSTTEVPPNVLGAVVAFAIGSDIVSIQQLEDTILTLPSVKLVEGTDYIVSAGVINFMLATPPKEEMWAFTFKSNREQIRNNFGGPISFIRDNDLSYLFGTQGMWYALWNGPAVRRVGVGLQILLGLPFARAGLVTEITTQITGESFVTVKDPTKGNFEITQEIDPWLDPAVSLFEDVLPFSRLSNGIEIYDWVNNPDIVDLVVRPVRNRFHTWVVYTLAEVIQSQILLSGQAFQFSEVTSFIERFKPEYTDYVIAIDLRLEEQLLMSVEGTQVDENIDLTSKTNFNYWNFLQLPEYLAVNTPFTEDPGDPPTSTPWPAEQVYHLDDENIKFLEEFTLETSSFDLTELVSDDANFVNHFDNPGFETENGLTEVAYAAAPAGTYPPYDLDAENIKTYDGLELFEQSSPLTLLRSV